MTRPDPFCPECGVRLDLHDDPDDCEEAEATAAAIERVTATFLAPFTR